MTDLVFSVRSESSGEIYSLSAYRTAGGVRFSCTCPAGEQGQSCKHRLGLLVGEVTSVVDVDAEAVERLSALISGSPIGQAILNLEGAENRLAAAKRDVTAAKKALGRAMMG